MVKRFIADGLACRLRRHYGDPADLPLPDDLRDLAELIERSLENEAWRRMGVRCAAGLRSGRGPQAVSTRAKEAPPPDGQRRRV